MQKGRREERKKTVKGIERTPISGRHAIGNVHERATLKKPEGKYPIQKGKKKSKKKGKCRKKRSNSKGEKRDVNALTLFVVLSLPVQWVHLRRRPILLKKGSNTLDTHTRGSLSRKGRVVNGHTTKASNK